MESRIIEITPSALSHGRLNIRACGADFFPKSAYGKPSKSNGFGHKLRLKVEGFKEPVATDIPTDTAGRPRWFFRERAWVKSFVRFHRLGLRGKVVGAPRR